MNDVEKRKAVAADILLRLKEDEFEPASIYFAFNWENPHELRPRTMENYLNHSGEVNSCVACQRGAMAMSVLRLGYDGDPKDADLGSGFSAVLEGLYPIEQIRLVEQFFEDYFHLSLGPLIPKHRKDRMIFITQRMLDSEDGLFHLTKEEYANLPDIIMLHGGSKTKDFFLEYVR